MPTIKTAIIGWGLSGTCFHAPIIDALPEFELVAVVSSRPEAVHADRPGIAVFPTIEALLATSEAELVVIASPSDQHFLQAKSALDAGRHVVVEKPFVLSSRHGFELDRLARAVGRVLAVYHNRRWDTEALTLQKVIRDGRIGRPHTLFAHFDRWRPQVRDRWRERAGPGGGVLWDLGPHLVDRALCVFGRPKTVFAELAARRQGAVAIDHFHLVLGYDGASAILDADCLTCGAAPSLVVHGDMGSFVKYGLDGQEALLRAGRGPGDPAWGQDDPALAPRLTTAGPDGVPREETIVSERGAYQDFYLALARAIRHGAASPVDAIAATDVVAILEAAETSHRDGSVVPFIGPAFATGEPPAVEPGRTTAS